MKSIKRKFETEIKTRINFISSTNTDNLILFKMLVKQGIFEGTDFMNETNYNNIFPTEILCSSPKSNIVTMYLSIKSEEDILVQFKNNILNSIYEAYLIAENKNYDDNNNEYDEFKKKFCYVINEFEKGALNSFYEEKSLEKVFACIDFKELFNELKQINTNNNQEIIDNKDEYLWDTYFSEFQVNFIRLYYKWLEMISKLYIDNEDGHQFLNENSESFDTYSNNDFKNLCRILFSVDRSAALIIERAYIEVPSSSKQFSGIVYTDYTKEAQYKSISKIIEERIGQDYKEQFIIIANSIEDIQYYSKLKENISKSTLNKRIFCILNDFNSSKDQYNNVQNELLRSYEDVINVLKTTISGKIGIPQDRIIVTEQFKDIDKDTLKVLNTCNDYLQLLNFIKQESENIGKVIKIKSANNDNIISISLNQERMSVQALMGMLYERYHGYLVELWNKIIDRDKNNKYENKYYYSEIHNIIRNRKDDYKGYKYVVNSDENSDITFDFSLRSGDNYDSKRILKMLVNNGYNIVGFDAGENKIIVNINGEISPEDKEKLIKSIKGRLEECAINYFESAFLMKISNKKFNTNDLTKALEIEKNITIDDFYGAFKEAFQKMSDNILRYEVLLQ